MPSPSAILGSYHQLERVTYRELQIFQKVNLRHSLKHPAVQLLINKADLSAERLLDASESAGVLALLAQAQGAKHVEARQQSYAAYLCALASCQDHPIRVTCAPLWNTASQADTVLLLPATDKGTMRVQADISGANQNLKAGGNAYLVMHKDQGAKRYEKYAQQLFGSLEVIAKDKGWRLVKATKAQDKPLEVRPSLFQVALEAAVSLELESWPGVYASGKLDPGSTVLIEGLHVECFEGKRLLDVGCGYGILSLFAARAGADVTALDDDLLAVASCRANAERLGLEVDVFHSDVDAALADETFEVVLMNPPFHVGKQVLLEVPQAFLAAAHKHLTAKGELFLVANRALPYEQALSWAKVEEIAGDQRFKVLRAQKL